MSDPVHGVPFGKYTLIRRIARGGMAELFLANHVGPAGYQREVAIKRILQEHATSEALQRDLTEAIFRTAERWWGLLDTWEHF